jgi:type I restriction enzyme S subunit
MKENNENKLVPRLRFQEFKNEGEWEETTLGNVSEITNGKSNAQDHVENGKYPLFDRSEVIKASNNFLYDCEAVIIPGEGMKFIPKYFKGKFDLHQRAYALKNFSVVGLFVYYSMTHKSKLLALKAVKSTVLSLRLPILKNFHIQVPKNRKEQQKIAACLSSLDDVINAESKKLEVLKEHKKGLLQNLFPQEGETVPKLRFKEFEDSGEWEVKTLGEVFTSFSGGTPSTSKKMYYEGSIPFIRSAEINKTSTELFLTDLGLRNSSAKMVSKGDLLVALYGANSGDVAISKIEGAINQAILCLKSEFSNSFVYHYLSGKKSWIVSKYIQGGQGNLSGEIVKSISVSFPSKPEQQKIAACLSSIDDLINAQSQKIETLKLHKKGLLQGLFPDVNEHNG